MAGPRVPQSFGHTQWWWRSLNTCCSKKILLLLMWYQLYIFSISCLRVSVYQHFGNTGVLFASECLAYCFVPLVGSGLEDMK